MSVFLSKPLRSYEPRAESSTQVRFIRTAPLWQILNNPACKPFTYRRWQNSKHEYKTAFEKSLCYTNKMNISERFDVKGATRAISKVSDIAQM
ncbi:hypothetical protein Tcan_14526 [Toxocara canis]|uniref:Uncharacterized protein n=1 Tax=Toxocara canis TaxID=6265 RepID=A0A0B2UWA0_TOXCA|nr:hypothetical protein Tcan_14526 [Toxocara canis]